MAGKRKYARRTCTGCKSAYQPTGPRGTVCAECKASGTQEPVRAGGQAKRRSGAGALPKTVEVKQEKASNPGKSRHYRPSDFPAEPTLGSGGRAAGCRQCGASFYSVEGFDAHRSGGTCQVGGLTLRGSTYYTGEDMKDKARMDHMRGVGHE